jgi:hypothetical protein
MNNTTLSRRPTRRFWGWGHADAAISPQEKTTLGMRWARPIPTTLCRSLASLRWPRRA